MEGERLLAAINEQKVVVKDLKVMKAFLHVLVKFMPCHYIRII